MTNDGKIYITISDRRFGKNVAEADAQNKSDKEKQDKDSKFGSWVEHQFFGLIKQQVMQNINFTVNNIGNFTGDYQAQRDAQLGLSLLNEAIGLGTSIYAGAKIGGVPGALIAIGVYGVNKTISTMQQYELINLQTKQNRFQVEILKERSGLNSYKDWSRGTEN